MRERSGSSTANRSNARALELLAGVLEGYRFHPFFRILGINLERRVDPPVLPFSHQSELLFRLSFRRPVRLLVGDEIGLGKTIEAILAADLIGRRDGAERILLLAPRILVEQWRSELKRFGVRARVLTRRSLASLRVHGFRPGWYIASIDLVKREEHKSTITSVDWDLVIVDEAHRVGMSGSSGRSGTLRYRLVEELASNPARNVILLSATPHRGDVKDYISRLRLVDPYLVDDYRRLDTETFYRLTLNSIVIRRTKMDVNEVYEERDVFKQARFVARVIGATREEVEFNERLYSFLRNSLLKYYEYTGDEPKPLPLLLTLVAKRASSSPYAAVRTLESMLYKRSLVVSGRASTLKEAERLMDEASSVVESFLGAGFDDYSWSDDTASPKDPDEQLNELARKLGVLLDDEEISALRELISIARRISESGDSRLRGVISLISEHLARGDKIVVFTEYKDTAKYLYNKLIAGIPGLARATALVTSEGVELPGWRRRERPSIEDLKSWLRRGRIKLIVSTDVASEGLNLQVANIVVNYEPSWSPVKVEQRLGRVWRLGQEKEVVSYTLFLAIPTDRDVLDILYKKLLAWSRTISENRVSVGEEIVIDMLSGDETTTVPIEASKGKPAYSEYKAILAYISRGRSGLEEYVKSIIDALNSLRSHMEKAGLTRRAMAESTRRMLDSTLGGFRGERAEKTLRDLFLLAARHAGLEARIDRGRIYAETFRLENLYDYYSGLVSVLEETGSTGLPLQVVSTAPSRFREVHLYRVTVFLEGAPIYSETVGLGVSDGGTSILKGVELLSSISEALSPDRVVSVVDEYYIPENTVRGFKQQAANKVARKVIRDATRDYVSYLRHTENRRYSMPHKHWYPRGLEKYSSEASYIGSIVYMHAPDSRSGADLPPIAVKRVEEAAMRVAMEYERRAGRIPEDISMKEHYDIYSRDPRTGETRYIEVKGRSGLDLEVELTEAEFEFAKKRGKDYWLYIVYGIDTGSPRLLAVRDPVRNMRWYEIGVKRYRLSPA